VSRRKCPDVKDLRRMVQHLGVELRVSQPSVPKAEFLLALHERFDDQITVEQQRYCVDKWSWPIARKAMQDVAAEAEELSEPRQLMLPLSMGHIKIPRALPIMVKGVPETVTAVFANDAEWYSFSVNATHGYPRDKDDVGRILRRIFEDPEWSHVPLREISRHGHPVGDCPAPSFKAGIWPSWPDKAGRARGHARRLHLHHEHDGAGITAPTPEPRRGHP
jgi:hypothetical protein